MAGWGDWDYLGPWQRFQGRAGPEIENPIAAPGNQKPAAKNEQKRRQGELFKKVPDFLDPQDGKKRHEMVALVPKAQCIILTVHHRKE